MASTRNATQRTVVNQVNNADFVRRWIEIFIDKFAGYSEAGEKYQGVHMTASGFNSAFKQEFGVNSWEYIAQHLAKDFRVVQLKGLNKQGKPKGFMVFKADPNWKPVKQLSTATESREDKIRREIRELMNQ